MGGPAESQSGMSAGHLESPAPCGSVVAWVLLLSGAACSCARDGASRTLLLVSVEVSEARSSMSTIDVDTVHSDERTISLAVIFVFIIYVRFIGIFYYPETPSDLRSGLDLVHLFSVYYYR